MKKIYRYHAFIVVRISFLGDKTWVQCTSEKLLRLEDWPEIGKEVKTLVLKQLIDDYKSPLPDYLQNIKDNSDILEARASDHIDVTSWIKLSDSG